METTIPSMLESIQELKNVHLPKTTLSIVHKLDQEISDMLELQESLQIDTCILNDVPEIIKTTTGYDSELMKVTSDDSFEYETFEFRIAGKFTEEEIDEIIATIESSFDRTQVDYIQNI